MISFCAIVRNEAENLPRCLQSVKDAVAEMIVLDTGSSDRTPEIAQEYGANVYHLPWPDDFSVARNECLKYAKHDWILVLDADEVLVPDFIPQMQKFVSQAQDYILINLIRQEVGAKQSPYSLVSRLFRNHSEVYFTRPYHAIVDDSIKALLAKEPHWKIASLANVVAILHDGYQAHSIASKNKLEKAQLAMEKFWENHPDDPYVCSKLGALYVQQGEINRGIELLERGLSSADSLVLYELNYHLGIAYSKQHELDKARRAYRAATKLEIVPALKLGAFLNLGNLLKDTGDLVGAKLVYEEALKIDQHFAPGYHNLGLTLKAMGNYVGAIALYERAIKLNPDYAEAYQNLGVSLFKIGKLPESLHAFQIAIELHSRQGNRKEAMKLQEGLKNLGL